jgi:hypothetical protein
VARSARKELRRRRRAAEEARRLAAIEDERRERASQEAALREQARQQMARHAFLLRCVEAGVLPSQEYVGQVTGPQLDWLLDLDELVDELRSDLLDAFQANSDADLAVAVGRPLSAVASFASFANGYGGLGLLLAGLSLGARALASDWKKYRLSEFRARWSRIFAQLDSQDREAFSRLFQHKYPSLVGIAADLPRLLRG